MIAGSFTELQTNLREKCNINITDECNVQNVTLYCPDLKDAPLALTLLDKHNVHAYSPFLKENILHLYVTGETSAMEAYGKELLGSKYISPIQLTFSDSL